MRGEFKSLVVCIKKAARRRQGEEIMNCLLCINFKDCKGKVEYQRELADEKVSCLDVMYELTGRQMPSYSYQSFPLFLHLYTNEDLSVTKRQIELNFDKFVGQYGEEKIKQIVKEEGLYALAKLL